MKNIIRRIYRTLSDINKYLRLRRDYYVYKCRLPSLLEDVFSKEKIKVVFFPINIGMWKNDFLFEKMLKHPRFDPYVVSFLVPIDSPDYQRRNQDEMRSFFQKKGYPYFDIFNFDRNEWLDLNTIKPDIIFYTQAVDVSYEQFKIKSFWKKSIFYYIPYCLNMENEKAGFNTLLFNISRKVFAASDIEKKYWSSFFLNKGENIVVSGYPSFDYLVPKTTGFSYKWKCCDCRKRVIWAPHHSIRENDTLNYSNFLSIADDMVEIARKYEDKIQFVFKPHPRLRPKLEQLDTWGVSKTAEYYKRWESMPNTSFVDGEYYDMFLTSDALIHDCSTFLAEYLLTGKPAMFVQKNSAEPDLNEYAVKCYQKHYKGHSIQDIETFLNVVVIDAKDRMKTERIEFVKRFLKSKGDSMVADKIFNEIICDLRIND